MKNLGGNEGGAVGLPPSHRSPSPLIRVRISDIVVGRRAISERGANFIVGIVEDYRMNVIRRRTLRWGFFSNFSGAPSSHFGVKQIY